MRAPKSYSSRPVLAINLTALAHNYQLLAARAAPAKIGASVKADAYGLGIEQIGRTLYGAGCRMFFVAHAGEGKILRKAVGNQPLIYVFSGPTPQDSALFFGANLRPVINSVSQARDWVRIIAGVKYPPRCALHFDTGMNRLGIPASEAETFIADKALYEAIDVNLIMSHLACASTPNHALNAQQLKRFKSVAARLPVCALSLANTGGIYLGKPYHFQIVRPGIGLYGGAANDGTDAETVRPVAEVHAPILQIKHVRKGDTLGYDGTFTAKGDMKLAIASAGYADGLPIALSGTDKAIITHAQLGKSMVPVVGRISMDYTILDITNADGFVELGQKAVFLGASLDSQAEQSGTISYEILTHLGMRCKRIYVRDDK